MNKNLFYPVEKVLASDIAPGLGFNSNITHAVVVNTPNGKQVVNFCSEDYRLVPNAEILPPLIGELGDSWKIEVLSRTFAESMFYIDVIFKNKKFKISGKDDIFPKLTIYNSYNGKMRYQFIMGFYRLICSNGLTIPIVDSLTKIKAMHTPKIEKLVDPDTIKIMVNEFNQNAIELMEPYLILQDQKVGNMPLRIESVIDDTAFPGRQLENVIDRATEEIQSGLAPTDWVTYNAFNYQLNHNEEIGMPEHKKNKLDQEVLDYLLRY